MSKFIVSISREYGSGGRIIGEQVAKALGAAFYDRELISLAAKESGFSEEFIAEEQESRPSFFNVVGIVPPQEQIFIAQSKIIKELAEKESCVIIGRCADYVLRDNPNLISVFIHAPIESRIKAYGGNTEDFVRKLDKMRAHYYSYFTQRKWGNSHNYNICVDSRIGVDATAKVVKDYVECRLALLK
ncbi:MAG: cytidylate kinase-like family protein [Clostridiales bacterium]|jgi:cytidylate kinase|nr:cytidylate kinase-like family protein [Clostridiales bacterium]